MTEKSLKRLREILEMFMRHPEFEQPAKEALELLSKPKTKLEDREKKFYENLKPYLKNYKPELLREFYDFWREPNKSGTQMRWELQKTWRIDLRLQRWARNSKMEKAEAQQQPTKPTKYID